MANAVRDLNDKVTLPDGFRICLSVRNCPPPSSTNLTGDVIEKVKLAMSQQYNVS